MKQTARMLGWTTNLMGVVVLILLSLMGYSLFDTLVFKQGIGFGEIQYGWNNESIHLSIPFIVNNTGKFLISDVILSTNISDQNGVLITGSENSLPHISEGSIEQERQELSLRLSDMTSVELNHLLIQDSQLRVDSDLSFTYANLVSFKMQLLNNSIPWGAPLHNLSINKPIHQDPFNATHYKTYIPISFENHAPLTLESVHLTLLNDQMESLSSKKVALNVRPTEVFSKNLEFFIENVDLQRHTDRGFIQLFLQTPENIYGPVEIPYG